MATYTEQLAYKQPTGAGAAELLPSPPTPWATYEDLPETPRATFTDQMPYLQSPPILNPQTQYAWRAAGLSPKPVQPTINGSLRSQTTTSVLMHLLSHT
ncbi:Kelch-like protein terF [Fusarium oxysporum f. sp. albedinis]|nr:Kelch-like protein terF [Fusarium oxysporum f. sp. albedinis]